MPAHRVYTGNPSAERSPEYRAWIATHSCVVPGCGQPAECCHFHGRRNGGDIGNCWPGCHPHHRESHQRGIKTFQAQHRLDLELVAAQLGERWLREGLHDLPF